MKMQSWVKRMIVIVDDLKCWKLLCSPALPNMLRIVYGFDFQGVDLVCIHLPALKIFLG